MKTGPNRRLVTPIAGWKMDPDWVDVFPIETGDFPASYVSLPEGKHSWQFCDRDLFGMVSENVTLFNSESKWPPTR